MYGLQVAQRCTMRLQMATCRLPSISFRLVKPTSDWSLTKVTNRNTWPGAGVRSKWQRFLVKVSVASILIGNGRMGICLGMGRDNSLLVSGSLQEHRTAGKLPTNTACRLYPRSISNWFENRKISLILLFSLSLVFFLLQPSYASRPQ